MSPLFGTPVGVCIWQVVDVNNITQNNSSFRQISDGNEIVKQWRRSLEKLFWRNLLAASLMLIGNVNCCASVQSRNVFHLTLGDQLYKKILKQTLFFHLHPDVLLS